MNSPGHQFLKDVNQHLGIVHSVCNAYFPYDPPEREDVFQEIMYQLWKSYPFFNKESKFSTWMYRVALNTAITNLRKTKRRPDHQGISEHIEQLAENNEANDAAQKIGLLYQGIDGLSPVDKAIVLLYLEENSYEEIAAVTGLTKTNVSVRLVRLKRILEEKLKDKF